MKTVRRFTFHIAVYSCGRTKRFPFRSREREREKERKKERKRERKNEREREGLRSFREGEGVCLSLSPCCTGYRLYTLYFKKGNERSHTNPLLFQSKRFCHRFHNIWIRKAAECSLLPPFQRIPLLMFMR